MKSIPFTLLLAAVLGMPHLGGAEWHSITVPGAWEEKGPPAARTYDGVAWYRTWVKVPDNFFNRHGRNIYQDTINVNLQDLADAHRVFVNGVEIGEGTRFAAGAAGGASLLHRHKIPLGTLRKGEWNEIAIRVHNEKGPGGFLGEAPFVMSYNLEGILAGEWEFLPGDGYRPGPALPERPPTTSFEHFGPSKSVLGRSAQLETGPKLTPAESLAGMRTADDLAVDLLLSEPLVAQPTHLSFDERGRLWVSQYRQYPYPAGLKMVSRNSGYESVYDRIPPAPPHHDRGEDRITIHEDTDGDGVFDRHKTFLEGLNMANAAVRGRGGVWVMHTPYLLFYPDANFDDVPDGPPVVHLQGFGLEDTHAVANSLLWGPDGWLYGAQGSTTTSRVTRPGIDPPEAKGIFYESGMVWRYHPETRVYEIFAKGGGNTFGLDLDSYGRLYGGHNGGQTHGWHFMPGGIHLIRHAYLRPPYAFGELPSMKPTGAVRRFTHFGAYVAGTAMPSKYQGHLFGLEPLANLVADVERTTQGSTFKTKDLGPVMWSDDVAFRPVFIVNAPDGSIIISDLYEFYIAHGQHYQSQIDPRTGRVYRLRGKDASLERDTNLAKKSVPELIALLDHPNQWHRRTALRLLAERKDPAATDPLRRLLGREGEFSALGALWALHQTGTLDQTTLKLALGHSSAPVRMWAVRLMSDVYGMDPEVSPAPRSDPERRVPPALMAVVAGMSRNEANAEVRSHLAVIARRLDSADALPLILALMVRDEDNADPYIPFLLWRALEGHLDSAREAVLQAMSDARLWDRPIVREHILPRLMRRFAVEGSAAAFEICERLLRMAPTSGHAVPLVEGFAEAYRGREMNGIPPRLLDAITATGHAPLALRLRRGEPAAVEEATRVIRDRKQKPEERIQYIRILGEIRDAKAVPVLLPLAQSEEPLAVRKAALAALTSFDQPEIATALLVRLPRANGEFRTALFALLSSRASWSRSLLQTVAAGQLAPAEVPVEIADRLRTDADRNVAEMALRLLPVAVTNREDVRQRVTALAAVIRGGKGDPRAGETLFAQTCASCHKLFQKGGELGPDLTGYQRQDVGTMLLSIIHPNAEIREGFEYHTLVTTDGRNLGGFLMRQDRQIVVLRGMAGEDLTVPRSEIKSLERVERSLMPEGLLDPLSPQQLRDLFAYLQLSQPL